MAYGLPVQRANVLSRLAKSGGIGVVDNPDTEQGEEFKSDGDPMPPTSAPTDGTGGGGGYDETEEDTDSVAQEPATLQHLPRTFAPSPNTPYPSLSDEDTPSQSDADDTRQAIAETSVGGGAAGTDPNFGNEPSALDTARQRLHDFDQPKTTKQKLIRALVMAAPVIAGGFAGATDNGVAQTISDRDKLNLAKRGQLEGDVGREQKAQETAREFDARQAATNLQREQLQDYRHQTSADREMRAATMVKQVGDRMMQYDPETQSYSKDVGPAKSAPTKPIHLQREGGKIIGATDEKGTPWSIDDPDLPDNLKPILSKAVAQDSANQKAAEDAMETRYKHQLDLQTNAQVNSATRQRAAFDHQDAEKAHKIVADQMMKESNLAVAEKAYADTNSDTRPLSDNTLVMEYVRHTLPQGSRLTQAELAAAYRNKTLPDEAMNFLDTHYNHELTPAQRNVMIGTVRTAVGATRDAAANAAAVYGAGGSIPSGNSAPVNGGGATPPTVAPVGTKVPVKGGGFKVKQADGSWKAVAQ